MSADDDTYFHKRAEEELTRAEAAQNPDVVRAHFIMAGFYLDFARNGRSAGALRRSG